MPIVGAQDVWKTGSRLYALEDTANGPVLRDIGTIQVTSPSTELEESRLEDSDGGVKRLVVKEVSKFIEKYEVVCYNLGPVNLRYLFYGNDAEEFTQASTLQVVIHKSVPGQLVKLKGSDGKPIFGLTAAGVLKNGYTPKAVNAVTGTTFVHNGADISADFPVGTKFWLRSNGTAAANTQYTVTAVVFSTNTTITVASTNSATATGTITPEEPASNAVIKDLERGIVSFPAASALVAGANQDVAMTPQAISGARLIKPQSKAGAFEGTFFLEWARGNFQQRTVREFTGILTPGAGAFSDTDYSTFPLNIEVQADITNATDPAGRLLYYKGNLPVVS